MQHITDVITIIADLHSLCKHFTTVALYVGTNPLLSASECKGTAFIA